MKCVVLALALGGCTFGINAIRPHQWHESRAQIEADAETLRSTGHRRMANKLIADWESKVSAPMWCMFGDMGLLIGGAGALSAAQALERRGTITQSMIEPINVGGLALSAIVFASLGASLKLFGHL